MFNKTHGNYYDEYNNDSYVADIEIGHTNASVGALYGGAYDLDWPTPRSPNNVSKVFSVGLQVCQWHQLETPLSPM